MERDVRPGAEPRLAREMGLAGLTATGVCSMVGAGINVIPFMIQRNVPGIGPFVLEAFAFAALPAVLAAIAYAVLASAMPRAGGSYVYASRGLDPYPGFVASFSQWFALSVAIGVVSYVFVPFVRDIAIALGWTDAAASLDTGWVRLTVSLAVLWTAAGVNLLGVALYERLMVPLMYLTFILAGVVIVAGFSFDHADFAAAVLARDGRDDSRSRAVARRVDVPFRLGRPLRVVHRLRLDCTGGGRGEEPRPQSAAGDRPRRGVGRRVLHAVHGGGVPRGALAVHRGRGAAPRPDGAGAARLAAAAVLDRRSSSRPRRWRWPRTCRRCCWRCRV